jgi:hypothetical protein
LSVTGSVTAPSSLSPQTGSAESEADTSTSFQCDECSFISKSDHGVKVHKGTKHRETQQPEQFRAESLDQSLTLTPVKETREEVIEETISPVRESSLDSHKEQSDSVSTYEQDCLDRSKRLDDHAKAQGSWCYECNDRCSNRSVLKRHMHNDHGIDIYPDIDMALNGGW